MLSLTYYGYFVSLPNLLQTQNRFQCMLIFFTNHFVSSAFFGSHIIVTSILNFDRAGSRASVHRTRHIHNYL